MAKPRKLKVYGWYGWRNEADPKGNRCQTREIMAAHSFTEVMRIMGQKRNWFWNQCETGNDEEIAVATARPGVLFWRPQDAHREPYTAVEPVEPSE